VQSSVQTVVQLLTFSIDFKEDASNQNVDTQVSGIQNSMYVTYHTAMSALLQETSCAKGSLIVIKWYCSALCGLYI